MITVISKEQTKRKQRERLSGWREQLRGLVVSDECSEAEQMCCLLVESDIIIQITLLSFRIHVVHEMFKGFSE